MSRTYSKIRNDKLNTLFVVTINLNHPDKMCGFRTNLNYPDKMCGFQTCVLCVTRAYEMQNGAKLDPANIAVLKVVYA